MASINQDRFHCCYQNWLTQRHQDLGELLHGLTAEPTNTQNLHLIEKSIKPFQDYHDTRVELAQLDAPSFFCPSWCTILEISFLWFGGCHHSLSIRLVYPFCSSELEAQLTEYLQGQRKGNLGDLAAHQLNMINGLQSKTVREEEKLSSRMATLQEGVADYPLVKISSRVGESSSSSSKDIDEALDAHEVALGRILGDADVLRLSTLKKLMEILTPLQAVDLLVASKKLHLSIHEWGKRRDLNMGKMQE